MHVPIHVLVSRRGSLLECEVFLLGHVAGFFSVLERWLPHSGKAKFFVLVALEPTGDEMAVLQREPSECVLNFCNRGHQ
jgi:hypothetical protein